MLPSKAFFRTSVIFLIFATGLLSKAHASCDLPNLSKMIRTFATAVVLFVDQTNGFSLQKTKFSRISPIRANQNLNEFEGNSSSTFDFRALAEVTHAFLTDISDQRIDDIFYNIHESYPDASNAEFYDFFDTRQPKLKCMKYLSRNAINSFYALLRLELEGLEFPALGSSINFDYGRYSSWVDYEDFSYLEAKSNYYKFYSTLTPLAYEVFCSLGLKSVVYQPLDEYTQAKNKQKLLLQALESLTPIDLSISRHEFIKKLLGNKLIIEKIKSLFNGEKDLYTNNQVIDEKALILETVKVDEECKHDLVAFYLALQTVPLKTINNPSFIVQIFQLPNISSQAINPVIDILAGSKEAEFSWEFTELSRSLFEILMNKNKKKDI